MEQHSIIFSVLLVLLRWMHWSACLLLVSAELFPSWILRRASESGVEWARDLRARLRRLSCWAWLIAAVSLAGWAVLTALAMVGSPELLDFSFAVIFAGTRYGRLLLLRFALLFLLRFGLASARKNPPGLFGKDNLVLAALVLLTLALTGHAAAGSGLVGTTHLLLDTLHLGIASVWPGQLVCFALCLDRLRKNSGIGAQQVLAQTTARFSVCSLAAVNLLGATGLLNGFFFVQNPLSLGAILYGKLLIAKTGLFLAMTALGAINLLILSPRIRLDALSAESFPQSAAVRALARNVAWEIVLGAALMLLVAILGTIEPPH